VWLQTSNIHIQVHLRDFPFLLRRLQQHSEQVAYSLKTVKKDNDYELLKFLSAFVEKAKHDIELLEQENQWINELMQSLDPLYVEKRSSQLFERIEPHKKG
jgi:hypothetical protein